MSDKDWAERLYADILSATNKQTAALAVLAHRHVGTGTPPPAEVLEIGSEECPWNAIAILSDELQARIQDETVDDSGDKPETGWLAMDPTGRWNLFGSSRDSCEKVMSVVVDDLDSDANVHRLYLVSFELPPAPSEIGPPVSARVGGAESEEGKS